MNSRALKSKLVLKDIKVDDLLERLEEHGVKMSRSTFYRNLKGEGEFDRDEIKAISDLLGLSDEEMLDIFFKEFVS